MLLAIAHTWPLAQRPAVHSRVDNGDYSLNVWAVDWVARTLPTDPAHLFDANIFHPARLTLAYSEPLILQGALAIPAVWLGVPPVLTYNLLILAGLALSGWAFALLVHRDTGSWTAGIVAGSAVAFNAHHLMRLVHVQALHLELLPLVFLALDRLLVTGRARYAALLGASVALQATASIYLLVFTGWAVACAWIARVPEWRHRLRDTAAWTALAVVTCALLLAPVLWPYWELSRTQGLVRGLGETQACAATWTDYLFTGSRLHFDAVERPFQRQLGRELPRAGRHGARGVRAGRRVRPRAARAHVAGRRHRLGAALGIAARCRGLRGCTNTSPRLAQSAATRAPGSWRWSAWRCWRDTERRGSWGRVLRTRGARRLTASRGRASRGERGGSRRREGAWGRRGRDCTRRRGEPRSAARAAGYREFPGIPAIYDVLRDEPQAVVIELPFYGRGGFFGNARYMINATRHRHPLVNGYSGFAPPGLEADRGDDEGVSGRCGARLDAHAGRHAHRRAPQHAADAATARADGREPRAAPGGRAGRHRDLSDRRPWDEGV